MNLISIVLMALLAVQNDAARDLVERLDSDRIDVRETAARKLVQLGTAAVPELEKAAQGNDLETAGRARAIIKEIHARQTLLRIEDTFKKATSLKLRFSYEYGSSDSEEIHQGSGLLILKEGNKARISTKPERSKWDSGMTFVSDGTQLGYEDSDPFSRRPSPTLKEDLSTIFVRRGYREALQMLFSYSLSESDAAVFMAPYRLTSLKAGPDDGETKTLSYEVVGTRADETRVKLWYHPKTHVMAKRVTQNYFSSGRTSRLVEKYDEVLLDSDVPDSRFALARK